MAYNATTGQWDYEDDSVQTKLTGILAKNSPYMQQAQAAGMKTANARGLLNSSIAVKSSQQAALNAAMPIASQDSSQIAQKNLSAQQAKQQGDLQSEDLASKERIASLNIQSNDREKLAAALAEANKKHGGLQAEVIKNNDIPADARNKYLANAAALRDSELSLLEQLYGIDLDWTTAAVSI